LSARLPSVNRSNPNRSPCQRGRVESCQKNVRCASNKICKMTRFFSTWELLCPQARPECRLHCSSSTSVSLYHRCIRTYSASAPIQKRLNWGFSYIHARIKVLGQPNGWIALLQELSQHALLVILYQSYYKRVRWVRYQTLSAVFRVVSMEGKSTTSIS